MQLVGRIVLDLDNSGFLDSSIFCGCLSLTSKRHRDFQSASDDEFLP